MQTIIDLAHSRMEKAMLGYQAQLAKIRTGRAHPSILNHIKVVCYDQPMPISQLASIHVEDARTLSIAPWDKAVLPAIEKAISTSDLGVNPSTSGGVVRVIMPALNAERRAELVRVAKTEAENARVVIRNVRRDANNGIKDQQKASAITQDDERRLQERVQKMTDDLIQEIDRLLLVKEQELMTI